jgi:predicted amidohydrolase
VFYTTKNHPGVAAARRAARKHKIWLLLGSVAVMSDECTVQSAEKKSNSQLGTRHSVRTYNRSLLFNPKGEIAASYDKLHLFDVEVGDGQVYRESAKIIPGGKAVVARLVGSGRRPAARQKLSPRVADHRPPATLGLTICYDVRFPALYRALAKAGADILAVPAAFTQVTGEAHWHVLLRARAIENGCFVIAPAQCGAHPGKRRTFGHSLIIDPWGRVLADAGTKEGIICADLDMGMVQKTRAAIPSLMHDRKFTL